MKAKDSAGHELAPGQTVAFNYSGEVRRGKIVEIKEARWRKNRPDWKTPEQFEREYPNEYRWIVSVRAEGKHFYSKPGQHISKVRNTKGILVIFEL